MEAGGSNLGNHLTGYLTRLFALLRVNTLFRGITSYILKVCSPKTTGQVWLPLVIESAYVHTPLFLLVFSSANLMILLPMFS